MPGCSRLFSQGLNGHPVYSALQGDTDRLPRDGFAALLEALHQMDRTLLTLLHLLLWLPGHTCCIVPIRYQWVPYGPVTESQYNSLG